jgi:hypothetical protein
VAIPALWRAIQLTDGRILHEKRAHIFEVWMARSGSGPLFLRISDGSSTVSQMLSSLGPHRGRSEYLDICVSRPPLSVFKGPMPLLRYLDLTVTDFGHALSVDVAPFQEVPWLRAAVLTHIAVSHVTLLWGQLTSLTLCLPNPYQYVSILLDSYSRNQISSTAACISGVTENCRITPSMVRISRFLVWIH